MSEPIPPNRMRDRRIVVGVATTLGFFFSNWLLLVALSDPDNPVLWLVYFIWLVVWLSTAIVAFRRLRQ